MAQTSSSTCTLPREKVFSIQIGTKLFRLSGASIASDAPSYFSKFFEDQLSQNPDGNNIRTLYIDRDPVTFQEIARHLRGYHCEPKDGNEFVKFFADAQFYHLPRLMSQLFECPVLMQIGDRHFQIPRDLFSSPGDTPNFFSLGFNAFFASPEEVFPGLDRTGLLRPPSIAPPTVPNRSGDVFAQLIHLLQGYPLHIQNETHREQLLRDCRYYHLRGLEQKLIPHHISYNPIHGRSEIIIRLEDVRRSGISVVKDDHAEWARVTYARPFTDDVQSDLIVELGNENTEIDLEKMRPKFLGSAQSRVASLLQVICEKSGAPNPASSAGRSIHVSFTEETDLTLNGYQQDDYFPGTVSDKPQAKRRRVGDTASGLAGTGNDTNSDDEYSWIVRNGQWRVVIRSGQSPGHVEFTLIAVKLDVYTTERARNRRQPFLGS
ncbi:hypothetical protein BDV18DRAFT_119359 [Aspergillus unguis]